MLYLQSKENAKVYVWWEYKEVAQGEVLWVSPSTYFMLQSNKNFIPLSSECVRGAWIFKLVSPSDGSIALSWKITQYKQWEVLEVAMTFVRSYILKWFVWQSVPQEIVVETIAKVVAEETALVKTLAPKSTNKPKKQKKK